jgi:hypothetical protein
MLRKVMLTGVVSVFRRGSLIQLIVGATLSLTSLAASAWFQPYEEKIANTFKVATEASLAMTLILAILLKMSEDDLQREGLDFEFVGWCMATETIVLPAAGLALAFSVAAWEIKDSVNEHRENGSGRLGRARDWQNSPDNSDTELSGDSAVFGNPMTGDEDNEESWQRRILALPITKLEQTGRSTSQDSASSARSPVQLGQTARSMSQDSVFSNPIHAGDEDDEESVAPTRRKLKLGRKGRSTSQDSVSSTQSPVKLGQTARSMSQDSAWVDGTTDDEQE